MTSTRRLDELLGTLRSEMNALDIGDEEARRRLDRLILDIETRIETPNSAGAGADQGVSGQLKASILKFEVSHPRLAGVMNDVLEKLSAMGI
jgi:hypothetical protein